MTTNYCAYLLSDRFNYDSLICPDAGPSVAKEYGWRTIYPKDLLNNRFSAIIVDNRHHDLSELRLLKSFILSHPSQMFLLRVVDPFVHHRNDNWYRFLFELGAEPNIHYISPYTLTGLSALLYAHNPRKLIVHAPYTYECSNELPLRHHCRKRGLLISGANDPSLYPLRDQAKRAAALLPAAISGIHRLRHPGYPDIGHSLNHNIIGRTYIQRMAEYTHSFSCSSSYRIELLKYREIAYAGCVPVGDLPFSLIECPPSAQKPWRKNWPLLAYNVRALTTRDSEQLAIEFREFMKRKRDKALLSSKVNSCIINLSSSL